MLSPMPAEIPVPVKNIQGKQGEGWWQHEMEGRRSVPACFPSWSHTHGSPGQGGALWGALTLLPSCPQVLAGP